MKKDIDLAKFFKHGALFLRECAASHDAKAVIKEEELRIKNKYGKEASITFLKGVRHGYTFFKDGYEYKLNNPSSTVIEDEEKIGEIRSMNGDTSADVFYDGMLYAIARLDHLQNNRNKKRN